MIRFTFGFFKITRQKKEVLRREEKRREEREREREGTIKEELIKMIPGILKTLQYIYITIIQMPLSA